MYKYDVGDFPLLDYPCKYWWVRYSVNCTLLTETFEKLWKPKLEELKKKYNFMHYSYRGVFNIHHIGKNKKLLEAFMNREILIKTKDGKERRLHPIKDRKLYEFLFMLISDRESISWIMCPYQYDKQSSCPFYEADENYLSYSLEELRKRKGHEV